MDCSAFQYLSFACNPVVSNNDQNVKDGQSDDGAQT